MQDQIVKKINKCLERIKKNDSAALEKLFLLTKEHLRHVAVYYLNDQSLVDDVLSDAYVHVVKYIESFDKTKNGYNWLFQIIKNIAFDYNKFQTNHQTKELEETDSVTTDYTETLVNIITVQSAMTTLDETERNIIHKIYWEEKNILQLSVELGIPYMTLHDRVKKIIKKLEKELCSP